MVGVLKEREIGNLGVRELVFFLIFVRKVQETRYLV